MTCPKCNVECDREFAPMQVLGDEAFEYAWCNSCPECGWFEFEEVDDEG